MKLNKAAILGLIAFVAITGSVFAEDGINPEFINFIRSFAGSQVELISVYPPTATAAEKLRQLRQGEMTDILVSEWRIGPVMVPPSSALIEMQKLQGLGFLAAAAKSYVRGEFYGLGFNEQLSAQLAGDLGTTIVFAETLRNSREELRLEYSYLTADGESNYGVSIWLSVEKASLDDAIQAKAAAVSSGNYDHHPEKKVVEPAERKTAGARKPSRPVNSTTDNGKVVESVQALMASDERIQRFRDENQRLLGFGE